MTSFEKTLLLICAVLATTDVTVAYAFRDIGKGVRLPPKKENSR